MANAPACLLSYKISDLSVIPNNNTIDPDTRKLDSTQNNLQENPQQGNNSVENETCCGENIDGPKFDFLLSQFWDGAQTKGLFRYQFKPPPSKVLPGKFQFYAQLNKDRAEKRREPEVIVSLSQPFNMAQFNFHKVKPGEVILQLAPWWEVSEKSAPNGTKEASHDHLCMMDASDHKIIINASPFEYGNILLVPFISSNYPQLITPNALRMAVEMMLLSRSRDFRVGFNSLCAFASVNHCHFHAYYLKHRLCIEDAELKQVQGPCYELCNYPAAGFAFILPEQLTEESLEKFISNSCKLIKFLQENNLPYNLYLTRGSSVDSTQRDQNALRLFVWARTPSCGSKTCDAFNPALCELAGHLPIKNEAIFETITEDYVAEELRSITSEVFKNVREQVRKLFPNDEHDSQ